MKRAIAIASMVFSLYGCAHCIKEPTSEPQVVTVPVVVPVPAPPDIQVPVLTIAVADWNPDWKCQDFLMIIMQDYAELYRWYKESSMIIEEYRKLSNGK